MFRFLHLIVFLFLYITSFSQSYFTVGTSTTLKLNDSVKLSITGDLNIDGDLTVTTLAKTKIINGGFLVNGNFSSGQGEFEFYSDANYNQSVGITNPNTNKFYNLTVTGPVSNPYDLYLLSDINVSNKLEIVSRKLDVTNLGIDLGTTGYLHNETNNNRVYSSNYSGGWIKSTATIGANITTNPGNLGLTITTHGNQMGLTSIYRKHFRDTIDASPSIYRVYDVQPQYNGSSYVGGLGVDLQFKYFLSDVGGDILSLENSFGLYHSANSGSTWDYKGGTLNSLTRVLSVNGYNQFSWLTLAPVSSTLPITLLYFKSKCEDNQLEWVTASEINNKIFYVQGSNNGYEFVDIDSVEGNNNSNQLVYYKRDILQYFDYYRLKQVDNDGGYTYSYLISGCKENPNKILNLYPNPNHGQFFINHNSVSTFELINSAGQKIWSEKSSRVSFDFDIPAGHYILKMAQGLQTKYFKFIKIN